MRDVNSLDVSKNTGETILVWSLTYKLQKMNPERLAKRIRKQLEFP
jgi:hypothetical protein